ncbi:MAG: hypothetical protein LC687_06375, partial [Actinobacteria bacterium]|nr:hypothetical protein [Actinomycetota bacterium]
QYRRYGLAKEQDQLRSEFPDAVYAPHSLGMHRGQWEGTAALQYLKEHAPEQFTRMMTQADARV